MANTAQAFTNINAHAEAAAASSSSHLATLEEVEALTNDLKRLLVKYESTLEQEGLRHEIETLERWMESYRRGLAAAHKISEKGTDWLADLRGKLKLAAEELQRHEGEGGNPLTKAQAQETEEMFKAVRKIDLVMPNIEQIFGAIAESEEVKS